LHLPRFADAALHGAVEVENQVCYFGAVEILAVEEIEDVEGGLDFLMPYFEPHVLDVR
jgi:hypothetical protein